jgi:hypothetical protein
MARFFIWIRHQLTPELILTQKCSIQIIREFEIQSASGDLRNKKGKVVPVLN